MNLPAAQFGVQSLICSVPVANAAPELQLTQCRSTRTSLASAQVRTNDEGRVCCLNRQLTTAVFALAADALCVIRAESVALVGADAQPVAATASRMAMSTPARFMVR